MAIFVSTAEPPEIKFHFTASPVCEQYGMDFIVSSKMGILGVQRKTIDDLLSSVRDGRLNTQVIKSADLKLKYMVIEGEPHTTRDGYLITSWANDITLEAFNKMLLTIGLSGYQIWRTEDWKETVSFVKTLEDWGQKDRHSTLSQRPGPEKDAWGRSSDDMRAVHFLQGLPSIGFQTAKALYESWGLPLAWTISETDLTKVPRIGKHRARELFKFINGDMF